MLEEFSKVGKSNFSVLLAYKYHLKREREKNYQATTQKRHNENNMM